MESRVDSPLKLSNGGKTVKGRGPVLNWELGELSAVVSVVIAQAQTGAAAPMTLALAAGVTDRFKNPSAPNAWTPPPDTWWTATAKVAGGTALVPGGTALVPGAAVAYAHALVENAAGELEAYDWTVHVVLES
jgi:hypothetical protein